MKVKDMMIRRLVTIKKDISLQRAAEILYEKHVGSLIVLDKDRKCEGIVTNRDILRAIARKTDLQTPLREIMTRRVITVPEDASFSYAKNVMIEHNIRHLPVRNKEKKIIGIVTIRSILDELIGYPTVKS